MGCSHVAKSRLATTSAERLSLRELRPSAHQNYTLILSYLMSSIFEYLRNHRSIKLPICRVRTVDETKMSARRFQEFCTNATYSNSQAGLFRVRIHMTLSICCSQRPSLIPIDKPQAVSAIYEQSSNIQSSPAFLTTATSYKPPRNLYASPASASSPIS